MISLRFLKLSFGLLFYVCVAPFAFAQVSASQLQQLQQAQAAQQSNTASTSKIRVNTQATRQTQFFNQQSQSSNVDVSRYMQSTGGIVEDRGAGSALLPSAEPGLPPPYGANLFSGSYEAQRSDGLNDSYLVAPGDKVSVWLWGAVSFSEVITVDNQGNLFVPDVGPVNVKDIPASRLNQVVTGKIKSVYTNNVQVYVNLLTATPVSLYVSGPVTRPGKYAGQSSDSLLYFLQRAGGIDSARGSYRNVSLIREGKTLASYDLYDFLREGKLEAIPFKDNDVILVAEQGAMVTVEGAARYPFRFELDGAVSFGKELSYYARPLAKVSHVGVIGDRPDGPVSVYLPKSEFSDFKLADGDRVLFNDDLRAEVISVSLDGSYLGPSFYTVKKDARLLDLLNYIQIDPNQADIKNIYIRRKSVAEAQKRMLDESLDRLERSVFTAPTSSTGEATIRAQEAQLVSDFVQRARQVQPEGKVIVASEGNVANVRLEDGDEIVIPEHTDLIAVAGEVLMPQAVVFNDKAQVSDYVAWAGGYTERANPNRIAIIHSNGLTTFVDSDTDGHWYYTNSSNELKPGDQILILPKVDTKSLQAVKDITQIMYQIAVAARYL